MLAADPNNRVAKAWELSYPLGRLGDPLGDVTWRRAQAKFSFGFNQAAIPDQGVAHLVTADSYEEDFFLLENDMAMLTFWIAFATYGYAREMLNWDMIESYEFHKLQLKMLDVQRSAERWVLKCPWHMWNPGRAHGGVPRRPNHPHPSRHHQGARVALQLVSPDGFETATQPRRQGARCVLARLHPHRLGAGVMESRKNIPESQIYDVRLRDLMANPMTVLQDIYSYFDLELTEETAGLLEARIAEKPTSQEGEHEYKIEDFGAHR